jgi:O-methyltransferase involved in polyketide biosynthesis
VAERVTLTGAAATLLGTLHARALDARSAHPVLGDRTADETVACLDYDFGRLRVRPSDAVGVAIRAKLLDRWTREFLAAHPAATVLHLGCGLDTRAERVGPGPGVLWFDVDRPEVIALRERLYAPRPGHRAIGASVTDPSWLAEVPRDRPALVVAEGLTMYLPAAEGPPLLRRLVRHLRRGELAFDSYSPLAVRLQRFVPLLRRTGARLAWGIADPVALPGEVPGLRVVEVLRPFEAADAADVARAPVVFRLQYAVLERVPGLRDAGHISRYEFDGVDAPRLRSSSC